MRMRKSCIVWWMAPSNQLAKQVRFHQSFGNNLMSNNPYEPGSDGEESANKPSDSNDAYNIVSDTVIGINARKGDNKFQAIFVFVSTLLFASVAGIAAAVNPTPNFPWIAAALLGGFVGMVVGLFASGIYLMIYRAARHLKGKHD